MVNTNNNFYFKFDFVYMGEIMNEVSEFYDLFCVDCKEITSQKYKGGYYDKTNLYICQECGCENYEKEEETKQ